MASLDLVIPVRNEEKHLEKLLERVSVGLSSKDIDYRIILVVDPSFDNTLPLAKSLQDTYPLQILEKEGKPGKGYSLIEGFQKSKADFLAFIDADLQYPPEKIPEMLDKLISNEKLGVVVANRIKYAGAAHRSIGSFLNKIIIGKLLLNLNVDIQSGLKVFRRKVFEHMDTSYVGPWTFDIPLLHTAKELGYKLGQVDIEFTERSEGTSNVAYFKTAYAIIKNAFAILLKESIPYSHNIEPHKEGPHLTYQGQHFSPHNNLHHTKSSIYTFSRFQNILMLIALFVLITSLVAWPLKTGIAIVAFLSVIYFSDVLFTLYLTLKSLHFPPEIEITQKELDAIDESKLPIYTILCPLYREANVVGQFVEGINKMSWPQDKLDVMLLLEEDDNQTIDAANSLDLPSFVRVVVVPHSFPKTKPKACNYGLHHAKGEHIVIYDAEDQPDPYQLKKAYLAFKQAGNKTACIQAKLNYYNTHQNLLTKLFTAEYSLWFDVVLPGLQSINTIIPLGGTSNHFRTKDLVLLGGWDAFNVTEDCDLGVRLFSEGFTTAIINSTTYEEANSNLKNWIRQRSRWIKGYLQTYFVHMREPIKFTRKHKHHSLLFQLIIGLRISFILINPILWATTIAYFTLNQYVGATIEALYPTIVFYMAAFSLVFGNFLYLYNYMIGLAKKEKWEVVKYVFFVPIYWAIMSISAVIAFYQLITKPHYWEKTHHGLDKNKPEKGKPGKSIKNSIEKITKKFSETELGSFLSVNINKLKGMLPMAEGDGLFLIACGIFGNLLGYVYNAFLSRQTSLEDFGLASLMGGFIFVTTIPLSALSRTVTHKVAYFFGKYNQPHYAFWKKVRRKTILIGVALTAGWIAISPLLSTFFKTNSVVPFLLFAPVWFFSAVNAVDLGYLTGSLKFRILGILLILEGIIKFVTTYILVTTNHADLMYVSFSVSSLASLLIAYLYAKRIVPTKNVKAEKHSMDFSRSFFNNSMFYKFSSVAYLSFDIILAKHYLEPNLAGQYALISLTGKMIFFISGLFGQFINPLISKEMGTNKETNTTFSKILGLSFLASFPVYIAMGIFGWFFGPILYGEKILEVAHFLPMYGFGMVSFCMAATIVSYKQVKNNNLVTYMSFALSILQIVLIGIFHANLEEVVEIMAFIGIVNLAVAYFIYYYEEEIRAFLNNFQYLSALFKDSYSAPEGKLNILFLNWYDTKHAWAGGAELYLHNIAKRLVKKGYGVTVFCGNDEHCARYEVVDGVQVIRRGGLYSVAIWAFIYYTVKFRGKYDLVVDVAKGVPFFAPLYVGVPVVGLVHHVHQEMFRTGLKTPLKEISMWLENTLMPFVYQKTHMLTVSDSTKKAMKEIGIGKNKDIKIIYNGAEVEKAEKKKTTNPSVIYIGRIRFYKRIDVLINAVHKLTEKFPNITLTIAGAGESEKDLKDQVKKLKLERTVTFTGKVTEQEKAELLSKSWVAVQPSIVEGWGITNIEANLCGTPVVASDVEGLRESVVNNKTGLLVEATNIEAFAKAIQKLLEDEKLREKLAQGGYEWSEKFSWDNSANEFLNHIYSTFDLTDREDEIHIVVGSKELAYVKAK